MREFLWFMFALIIIFTALYAGAVTWQLYQPESRSAAATVQAISTVIAEGWKFARPLLQLVIVVLVLQGVLKYLGFDIKSQAVSFGGSAQLLIAVVVVVAFALAALVDIDTGLPALKDLALVIVGFYFGTHRNRPGGPVPTNGGNAPPETKPKVVTKVPTEEEKPTGNPSGTLPENKG